jgi:hypothetical protein
MNFRIAPVLATSVLLLAWNASSPLRAENPPVLTWHNDNGRTGLNARENILTHANVNAESFGKVGFYNTDGKVDGQPLYVPNLTFGSTTHNVVYFASEHDTVYARDGLTGTILWKVSLLKAGETPSDVRGCVGGFNPQIGVTSTPVIDLNQGPHGAIYLVSMSKDSAGKYHQRINALDLITGAHILNSPTEIAATYPGTGDNSSNGNVVFDPAQYTDRAALLEWNGTIYTTWASHCDARPYTGWIIGYDAATLKQSAVLNITPNGSDGAVWMSGAGPAAGDTKIYFLDGNGDFDTALDDLLMPMNRNFGNSFMALSKTTTGPLRVVDYYATDNTVQQSNADTDFGSGGVLLLPNLVDNNGNQHLLAVAAGKDTNIYVVDRNNMGKYHPNGGEYATPAYFNNKVYIGGVADTIKAFEISNAKLVSTPVSRTPTTFLYPGATPSISAHGTSNGIVWAVRNATPAALYAYNADDLSEELYNSNQEGTRDQFGAGNKFVTPLIANGRVYVGGQTGVAVFGLLK